MDLYPLYTYKNLTELRKIQEDNEIFSYDFQETSILLKYQQDIIIDITSLIYFFRGGNKADVIFAYRSFKEMTSETRVIIKANLSKEALEIFHIYFPIMNLFMLIYQKKTKIQKH